MAVHITSISLPWLISWALTSEGVLGIPAGVKGQGVGYEKGQRVKGQTGGESEGY